MDDLLKKVRKLEEEAERNQRIINQLDERAGAAFVDSHSSDSDVSTMSLPRVRNEVEQRDATFAKDYVYTTNVSKFRNCTHLLHVDQLVFVKLIFLFKIIVNSKINLFPKSFFF